MLFFRKKKTKAVKVDNFKKNVALAFTKVKEDTQMLYKWIEHLSSQNQLLQTTIDQLRSELKVLPRTDQEIKEIVDKYYSFEHIFNKLEEMESRVALVERGTSKRFSTHQVIEKPREFKHKLHETIVKRISKNSKEYIKNILISLVGKYQSIAGPQLKEMVVEEQKLCSKSSFYRLLEELEKEEKIGVVSSGKLKYFTTKLQEFI